MKIIYHSRATLERIGQVENFQLNVVALEVFCARLDRLYGFAHHQLLLVLALFLSIDHRRGFIRPSIGSPTRIFCCFITKPIFSFKVTIKMSNIM